VKETKKESFKGKGGKFGKGFGSKKRQEGRRGPQE